MVASRRKVKNDLMLLWELADRLNYTGNELKRLSKRPDFGALDWDMTRPGKNQSVAIPLDVIEEVLEKLKKCNVVISDRSVISYVEVWGNSEKISSRQVLCHTLSWLF